VAGIAVVVSLAWLWIARIVYFTWSRSRRLHALRPEKNNGLYERQFNPYDLLLRRCKRSVQALRQLCAVAQDHAIFGEVKKKNKKKQEENIRHKTQKQRNINWKYAARCSLKPHGDDTFPFRPCSFNEFFFIFCPSSIREPVQNLNSFPFIFLFFVFYLLFFVLLWTCRCARRPCARAT
jgi:hypothetical protein